MSAAAARLLCGALGAAGVLLPATPVFADEDEGGHGDHRGGLNLAADFEGAAAVDSSHAVSGSSLGGGTGFKGRIGAELRVPFVRFTPEAGYGYTRFFAVSTDATTFNWDANRIFAGVRVGVGEIIVPAIYGHLGYGWRHTGVLSVPDASGVTFDAGLALDLRVLPIIGIGAHAEYTYVDAGPFVPQWVAAGLHVSLTL